MKSAKLFLFLLANAFCAYGQLVVNSAVTPAQLVNGLIGSGLAVSNISLNCPGGQYGTFSNGNTTNLGITAGSVFTTGSAAGAQGPNFDDSYTVNNFYTYSDADLMSIEPLAKYDPCILTFDIIPTCDTLTIRFVFGSEEYHEFVNSGFNDAFGFFITGPNPAGGNYNAYNIARLPNLTPVSVDNINNGYSLSCFASGPCTNCGYFVDNCLGGTIEYDGMTAVITSNVKVTPCATYTFKIAIADAGDNNYDSGVFIDLLYCSTAITATSASVPTCSCNGTATVTPTGGNPPYTYSWNTIPVQTTQTATGLCSGTYVCTVKDQNGCVANSNSTSVTVSSLGQPTITASTSAASICGGVTTATLTAGGGTSYIWSPSSGLTSSTAAVTNANPSSTTTYTVTGTAANGCTNTATVTITVNSVPTASVNTPAAICNGQSASLSASGGGTYTWSPSTGLSSTTSASPTASPSVTTTYTVVVTGAGGCTSTATTTVTVKSTPPTPSITVSADGDTLFCNLDPAYTSFQWYRDNVLLSGQTNYYCVDTIPGIYKVVVKAANGCDNFVSMNRQLPITLLSFTAEYNGKTVEVNWKTSLEINNEYFTVEKTTDGTNFIIVAIIKGAGNSSVVLNYFTVDDHPYSGLSYYRLRQTDYDGKFEFSNLVAVRVPQSGHFDIQLYKSAEDVSVHYFTTSASRRPLKMEVTDMLGKVVFVKTITANYGEIDFSLMARGVYMFRFSNDTEDVLKKFIY